MLFILSAKEVDLRGYQIHRSYNSTIGEDRKSPFFWTKQQKHLFLKFCVSNWPPNKSSPTIKCSVTVVQHNRLNRTHQAGEAVKRATGWVILEHGEHKKDKVKNKAKALSKIKSIAAFLHIWLFQLNSISLIETSPHVCEGLHLSSGGGFLEGNSNTFHLREARTVKICIHSHRSWKFSLQKQPQCLKIENKPIFHIYSTDHVIKIRFDNWMKTPSKRHNKPTGEAACAKVCMYIWQSCANWIIWKAKEEKRLPLTKKRDRAEWRTLTCTQKRLAVQNVKSWRVNAPLLLLLVSPVSSAGELCQYQHQILIRIKTSRYIAKGMCLNSLGEVLYFSFPLQQMLSWTQSWQLSGLMLTEFIWGILTSFLIPGTPMLPS